MCLQVTLEMIWLCGRHWKAFSLNVLTCDVSVDMVLNENSHTGCKWRPSLLNASGCVSSDAQPLHENNCIVCIWKATCQATAAPASTTIASVEKIMVYINMIQVLLLDPAMFQENPNSLESIPLCDNAVNALQWYQQQKMYFFKHNVNTLWKYTLIN